ncbi:MAG: dihydrodipicolinate synthase family protein [Pirellulales bacterium]
MNSTPGIHSAANKQRDRAMANRRPAKTPTSRFTGVVAAMVTPCKSPGEIDPEALSHLCRMLVAHGCHGLFVVASTGEGPLLSESDRRSLTVAAREAVPTTTSIYTGVSGLGLKQTIQNARHAAADGADAAVVMTPFFVRLCQEEVAEYVLAVADASPIPVVLYHHARMATPFDVEAVARAAHHPNIVGMKDSSHAIERVASMIEATADADFAVLQGNESLVYESMLLGAQGMATALAGVVPEWHAALYEAVRNRDLQSAEQYGDRIAQLREMFLMEEVSHSISAFTYSIKLALRRRGWLERLDGMLTGFTPDDSYKQMIHEYLNRVGVPSCNGHALPTNAAFDLAGN